ncbi:hypothetical protein [Herminiimonas sp. CN]|uniref:hypothetical protein n=1 Tax=Herminiimonas sp. CN TaxID=1349818 RepID=UPI0004732D8D|nr:hypothetical protein [Herminiimonas sp. CN]
MAETFPVSLGDPALSSMWDGLSPHLIASFYPVERDGSSRFWKRVQGMPVVRAPLTDCNLDISLGWQSPFENAGQSAMPSLKAMLSSGALQPWVGDDGKASQFIGSFEGRTGITKLNSQQVFSGMPPLKFQMTALFRAWRDPVSEVAAPLNQLVKWALPDALADDGPLLALLEGIKKAAQGQPLDKAMAPSLLPSTAPTKIAMKYKGRTYMPLVIESITLPLGSPIDANGNFVDIAVPMTICSLAAIDGKDWDRTTNGKGFSA